MSNQVDQSQDLAGESSGTLRAADKASDGVTGKLPCPITRRPWFMDLEHPELGVVPTYGGPLDSYTIPEVDDDGHLQCERYDHDAGDWVEGGEPLNIYLTTEQPCNHDLPAYLDRHRQPEIVCEHGPQLTVELRRYLDTITIDSNNIGDIRRSCFVPWRSAWNGIVRDETAQREAAPEVNEPADKGDSVAK